MSVSAAPVLAVLAGLPLIAAVMQDAFEVMLLPRRVQRRVRIVGVWFRFAWHAWRRAGGRFEDGPRREAFLGPFGPLSMLLLFVLWAGGLITGYGLLEWALQPAPHASPIWEQFYMSGVTFFTLGYGDVVPHTGLGRMVAVIEAGNGIGFIAVVIGYLPVLYQFFSRREAHVIQLDGRAGSPPTAGTLLMRHAQAGGLDQLDMLLRDWEIWASELLESHLSYPMLAYYRSQHDNESWLAALGCVMDTCALVLVGVQDVQPLQARMTFTMTRQVLVEMARSFRVQPSRYSGGDRLDAAAHMRLEEHLVEAGVDWQPGPEGRQTLAALRATYEPLLDGLSSYLLLRVPGWLPGEDASDNWMQGPRGLIAGRLVEELSTRSTPAGADPQTADEPGLGGPREADTPEGWAAPSSGVRLGWRRLRQQLKTAPPP